MIIGKNSLNNRDYKVICDICGGTYMASNCRLQWNNLFTCPKCYETRHPQEFVRGIKDDQSVPIARQRAEPTFITGKINPNDL